MKIGICYGVGSACEVESFGFDYLEFGLNSVVPFPEKQEEFIRDIHKSGIKCEAFNGFFPWSMILVGPKRNLDEIKSYIDSTFDIMSKLGGKVAVMGCGGGRRTYEGCTKEQALADFGEVALLAAKAAEPYGIKIAIEALNYTETDILNTVVETAEFARALNQPNLGMLADWYHMGRNGESQEDLLKVSDVLFHMHISTIKERTYPLREGDDQFTELFDAMRRAGYNQRISIEGKPETTFEEDGAPSAKFLKSL